MAAAPGTAARRCISFGTPGSRRIGDQRASTCSNARASSSSPTSAGQREEFVERLRLRDPRAVRALGHQRLVRLRERDDLAGRRVRAARAGLGRGDGGVDVLGRRRRSRGATPSAIWATDERRRCRKASRAATSSPIAATWSGRTTAACSGVSPPCSAPNVITLLRPRRLARYIAQSALSTSSSLNVASLGQVATPMLMERVSAPAPNCGA